MSIRVFIVEDFPQGQAVQATLLQELGDFRIVGGATTEAEANLWLLENLGGWDLAILDLVLAQGTGMGVIAKARLANAPGKILVFSDYVTPGIRKHCLALGADSVISKGNLPEFMSYCLTLLEGAA
jgi:DNA-binding NarL/FixJ family response regulator